MLPSGLPALEQGLQLLNRADPFVQVSVSETTGEWLLGAAGEIHLETCLKDLRERCAPRRVFQLLFLSHSLICASGHVTSHSTFWGIYIGQSMYIDGVS